MCCKCQSLNHLTSRFSLHYLNFLLRFEQAGTYNITYMNTITVILANVEAKAGSSKISLEAEAF